MEHDEMERLLADRETIVPSSGFVAAVMDVVQREASRPPAIPFPWKQAIPGIVGLGVAILAIVATLAAGAISPAPSASGSTLLAQFAGSFGRQEIAWTIFALTVGILPAFLSVRVIYGRQWV